MRLGMSHFELQGEYCRKKMLSVASFEGMYCLEKFLFSPSFAIVVEKYNLAPR